MKNHIIRNFIALTMCAYAFIAGASADVPSSYIGVWSGDMPQRGMDVYIAIRSDSTGGAFSITKKGELLKAYEFDFLESK